MKRWYRFATAAAMALALTNTAATCQGSGAQSGAQPRDVDVPGVDTHDFTPREKHEFSGYVEELAAPCPSVAVPIAECVIQKRPCAACSTAAAAIAKAVRDGMTSEQVHGLYKERFDTASVRSIPVEGSPSRGPEGAPVVVVEFADFECPFCQKLAPDLDEVWEARKDRVRLVYKFLPLSMHRHGEIAARAAIAAQMQGRFWDMHRLLFANGQHLEESDLVGYAKAVGLDVDRFRADMASETATRRIEADRKLADSLGVKGTPTLFIDGREYAFRGEDAKADLKDFVDAELAARQH